MQTKAIVTETDGTYAIVETERTSACEGCHKATDGGCSVCSLMGSDRRIRTRAYNRVGASVGDRVTVESNTSRMLWYALLVFVLPILVGLGGWLIAGQLSERLLWQALGGAIGFVGTFVGIFIYSRVIEKKRCDVEITEILSRAEQA